jgi:tetratricopeptide (TPR) repeat protein
VHTSAEALQQLLYLSGKRDIVSDVLPALLRPSDKHWSEPAQHKSADLNVVEISSGKDCRSGDVAIQINYLETYFSDFFMSTKRARRVHVFWELARAGDPARLQAFLEADPIYDWYSEHEQALLSSISVRDQEYDDLLADMAAITDLLGKSRTLFVTHVNAVGSDGGLIAARDKHIRWVKQAAQKLDVECFEPTQLMHEFGQEKAMERGGLDTTHYTNAFSDRLYALLHRQYVLPRLGAEAKMEDAASFGDTVLSDSIAAAINDDFYDGSRQLFSAIRGHPDHPVLEMLRGQVLARIGDYQGASGILAAKIQDPEMTVEMRKAAMRALLETGDPTGALDIASQLMSDEYGDVEIYEAAGSAAELLNSPNDAVHYRKLAFRLSPTNHATAISVLEHYRITGQEEQFADWLEEVLDLFDNTGDVAIARGIAEWAIAVCNQAAITRALVVLARRNDAVVLPALLEEAIRAGMQAAVAPAIATIAGTPNLNDKIMRALRGIAADWGESCQALLVEGRLRESYAMAVACTAVTPGNRAARRVQRSALNALAAKVREAVKAGDDAAVVEICTEAGDMVRQRRDTALAFVKALIKRQQLVEAQVVAQRLYEASPLDLDYSAILARVADLNGDFLTALKLYGDLSTESSESTARYRLRIDQFIARARKTWMRHVRSLVAEGRFSDAIQLCRLVENDSNRELVEKELKRILSTLRSHVRQASDRGESLDTLEMLQLMLQITPSDALILRGAALDAMKRQKFELALEFWRRLEAVAPGLDTTSRQIKRCEIIVRRQNRASNLAAGRPTGATMPRMRSKVAATT